MRHWRNFSIGLIALSLSACATLDRVRGKRNDIEMRACVPVFNGHSIVRWRCKGYDRATDDVRGWFLVEGRSLESLINYCTVKE